MKNTVVWIAIHCVLHVALGTVLAFILYKKPHGWKFVRVTYMIPNIISQSAIAMIFLNLYNAQYGALNSLLKATVWNTYSITGYSTRPPLSRL